MYNLAGVFVVFAGIAFYHAYAMLHLEKMWRVLAVATIGTAFLALAVCAMIYGSTNHELDQYMYNFAG